MAQIATVNTYNYAAGTCTLRLVGELSPLSQVTGRPVLGRSRFHLQLHDGEVGEAAAAVANPAVIEVSGREPQFSALTVLVQTYVQRQLNADALAAAGAVSDGDNVIQPLGLTRHRLTLATPPEPPKIVELSTLQLADLADALEQAEGNLQIIPDQALPKARRVRPRLPLWVGSVAAVGIAALLGNQLLTTAPGPVVLSPSEPQTTNESGQPLPPSDRQQSLAAEGGSPAADSPAAESVESPPAVGEALPAPTTTAPAAPAAPANDSTDAVTPKPPPPRTTSPTPPNGQPPLSPAPATDASPQAEAGGGAQLTSPDPSLATELAPAPASPDERQSARSSPEAFDAGPDQATTAVPRPDLEWINALTLALQQQWRSPANLAAPLRYSLTLGSDGTVEALEPLDDLAVTYQNDPTLPQPGTVIPGIVREQPSTVEVQFLPTGEVVVVPPES